MGKSYMRFYGFKAKNQSITILEHKLNLYALQIFLGNLVIGICTFPVMAMSNDLSSLLGKPTIKLSPTSLKRNSTTGVFLSPDAAWVILNLPMRFFQKMAACIQLPHQQERSFSLKLLLSGQLSTT